MTEFTTGCQTINSITAGGTPDWLLFVVFSVGALALAGVLARIIMPVLERGGSAPA